MAVKARSANWWRVVLALLVVKLLLVGVGLLLLRGVLTV